MIRIARKIIVTKLHWVSFVALKTCYSKINCISCLAKHDFSTLDVKFTIFTALMSPLNTTMTRRINTEIPSSITILNKEAEALNHWSITVVNFVCGAVGVTMHRIYIDHITGNTFSVIQSINFKLWNFLRDAVKLLTHP